MKNIIEIGDNDVKEQIVFELESIVSNYYDERDFKVPKFIIPIDFDTTVKKFSENDEYASSRQESNQLALGITIRSKNLIVINPILFQANFDTQIRSSIYHHEVFHYNYNLSTVEYDIAKKTGQYLSFMNKYLEEYKALNHGLLTTKEIFEKPTERFVWFINLMTEGHYENLKNQELYHMPIKKIIYNYKHHLITLEEFLKSIFPKINSYTLELLSYTAYKNNFKEYIKLEEKEDMLLNKSTKEIDIMLSNPDNEINDYLISK